MRTYDVTPEHLWRRARQANPHLTIGRFVLKRSLKDEDRQSRLKKANKNIQRVKNFFLNCVYVDQCWIPIQPQAGQCICLEGQRPVVQDPRLRPNTGMNGTLCFMLAVHPAVGLLHFSLLSPTPTHPMHGLYKVSYCSTPFSAIISRLYKDKRFCIAYDLPYKIKFLVGYFSAIDFAFLRLAAHRFVSL